MISESLPGTLEVPRKSQIRESFGPVQRNAMPTAPARGPAMIQNPHSRGLRPLPPTPRESCRGEVSEGASETVLKSASDIFGSWALTEVESRNPFLMFWHPEELLPDLSFVHERPVVCDSWKASSPRKAARAPPCREPCTHAADRASQWT